MALEFVGSAEGGGRGGEGSETIDLPVGTTTGDIVIVCVVRGSTIGPTINTSGYNTISSGSAGDPSYLVAYKIMGETPDTSVEIANKYSPTCLHVWRGVDVDTPEDATATTANGATGNPDCPSITTTTNGAVVIACGFVDDDRVHAENWTAPSGYTNLAGRTTNEGGGQVLSQHSTAVMAAKTVASAGAEDPAAFSSAADDQWRAVTVALRPAEAGGGEEEGVGSASGTATATAVSNALKEASGSSTGAAAASGTSEALKEAAGSAAGLATVTGAGSSEAASAGSASGTATVSATSNALKDASGSAAGLSTATAVGEFESDGRGFGTASGTSTATAVSNALKEAVGAASGTATVTGVGATLEIRAAPVRPVGGLPLSFEEWARAVKEEKQEVKELDSPPEPKVVEVIGPVEKTSPVFRSPELDRALKRAEAISQDVTRSRLRRLRRNRRRQEDDWFLLD